MYDASMKLKVLVLVSWGLAWSVTGTGNERLSQQDFHGLARTPQESKIRSEGPPCFQPESIAHGVTDWDGKSSISRYACFQGYHLVGPPTVECRYGRWYSEHEGVTTPTCKPITCNHPHIINGRLETGESVRYRSGEEAQVLCDEGYQLRTPSLTAKIICKEDGSWDSSDHSQFPSCREKGCPFPDSSIPAIENGSLEINGMRIGQNGLYKPGSVALYHCKPSYLLVPLSAGKRVCTRGKWGGALPACISEAQSSLVREYCPAPPSINNGYYYTDRGSETPLALPKASSRMNQYERGNIARYHCKEGYTLKSFQGKDIYRCMSDGEWSPKVPPVCMGIDVSNTNDPLEQVMCPSPPLIPYTDFERIEGWLTSNGAIHGTVLEYSCRVGYRDSRTPCLPTRRTCHAGQWIGRKPTCVPFDYCERPPIISHGFMTSNPDDAYHVLSEVLYQCHFGYRMKGSKLLKCHATGCWMPNELPECVREDLYDPGWNTSDGSEMPLIPILVSISIACSGIAVMTTICMVILCRRKGGHAPSPSGPAHWSTTVTVTPECSRQRETLRNRQEQDRMALIAFADGVQQVTLPSYEEALRDSAGVPHYIPHLIHNEYDNPLTTTSTITAQAGGNGSMNSGYRHLGISTTTTRNSRGTNGHHTRRTRQHPSGGSNHRFDNLDALSQHSVHAWPPRSSTGGHHRRRRENDALSDSVSHHSVNLWPRSGGHQLQHQPTSLRSSSGGSASASIETMGGYSSENTQTQTTLANGETFSNSTSTSQTPSCRALAGSLASFDTSSIVNTEGVPLLEEHELETEASNSTVSAGDTGSATYSETSSKH
ncbi:CUB and sushi domain-containing protein 3-like [Tigriopus californicus]|uniref:CUB and sushi domain-containing protein 3-like n=1 Tax=Tigriopus californicus TaxID=6832 RepID=UPI0027DA3289|nr:CUB and sushi domain-containing protein 3-like [Tigriopus californicus]